MRLSCKEEERVRIPTCPPIKFNSGMAEWLRHTTDNRALETVPQVRILLPEPIFSVAYMCVIGYDVLSLGGSYLG